MNATTAKNFGIHEYIIWLALVENLPLDYIVEKLKDSEEKCNKQQTKKHHS